MPDRKPPRAPAGLGAAGRRLWRDMHAAVAADFELDERETSVLALACRQLDDVVALESVLAASSVVVTGSQGQPRLSALVGELRQSRLAVARLLGEIKLPDVDNASRSARSKRAQHAAAVRWAEHAARRSSHGA